MFEKCTIEKHMQIFSFNSLFFNFLSHLNIFLFLSLLISIPHSLMLSPFPNFISTSIFSSSLSKYTALSILFSSIFLSIYPILFPFLYLSLVLSYLPFINSNSHSVYLPLSLLPPFRSFSLSLFKVKTKDYEKVSGRLRKFLGDSGIPP